MVTTSATTPGEVIQVTPLIAKQWLDRNPINRPISHPQVLRYARDMRDGRWHLTHEAIGFDREGRLLDGQHRLQAIIECGLTIPLRVVRGLDPAARYAIDTGRPRSVFHVATLLELGASEKAVTTAKYMLRRSLSVVPTHEEVIEFYGRHRVPLEFAAELLPHRRGSGGVIVVAPVARAWYSAEHDRLREFCQVITTGIMEGPGDVAAVLLRDLLLEEPERGRQRKMDSKSQKYWKVERALDNFLRKERLTRLYAVKEELFPLPEELDKPR